MIIEDGTGSGFRLKIDAENRAAVFADTRSMIAHYAAHDQEAYIGAVPYSTISGAGGRMFYLKNTRPGNVLILSTIFTSWNGGLITGTKCVYGTMYSGDAAPTGRAVQSYLGNLHSGSGNVADADVYYWDGTGTGMEITGGSPGAFAIMSKGFTPVDYDNSFLLAYNDSLSIHATPEETGVFAITLSAYFVPNVDIR